MNSRCVKCTWEELHEKVLYDFILIFWRVRLSLHIKQVNKQGIISQERVTKMNHWTILALLVAVSAVFLQPGQSDDTIENDMEL